MRSDLEIARSIPLEPIAALAGANGLSAERLVPYGRWKAKVEPGGPDAPSRAPSR
jgi:formate--tetrahydrofolate ligase